MFLQPVLFSFFRCLKQTNICTWLCSCFSLIFIYFYKTHILFSNNSDSNEYQIHLFSVSLSWLNLKCTSFYLENPKSEDFLNLITYCFYPPTFFTGPFISYKDFKNIYLACNKNKDKYRQLMKNLMLCLSWYMFGNFCLHFTYVNATSFQPQVSM